MKGTCVCKEKECILLDTKTASRMTSFFILGAGIIFTAGYYIGKQHAQYHHIPAERTLSSEPFILPNDQPPAAAFLEEVPCITQVLHSDETPHLQRYVAILAGYGTERAAQHLVDRLKKNDILAEVKTRVSSQGVQTPRTWYQVVTTAYEDKETLMAVVERIKQQERIRTDIRIVDIYS